MGDSDVATAVDDVLTALRAADAKAAVKPANLPVDIATTATWAADRRVAGFE
ncbi:hypothetical protein [Streptomyces sp. NL15-2K]|uniref:hypothetical protein n=1 Tax=Streptomyces sp. NL15-2K TaxID=376149 RepID=UPI000FF94CCA|nr:MULTISPECIES: hypothetical protein [Actinomycetes]WKX15361.1 hypothetical protein Q4V64_50860 [Kutzneria buriramensis]GCB53205.1 hypothetical protein SNL152K_10562 [Streptomyces sp. NL15-2K]